MNVKIGDMARHGEKAGQRCGGEMERFATGSVGHGEVSDKLAASPVFSDMGWDDVCVTASFMGGGFFRRGSSLVNEGDRGGMMFVILSGRVSVEKDDGSGKRKRIAELGPGKTIGEMSLFDGEGRSATCVAIDDCRVAMMDGAGFAEFCSKKPVSALAFSKRVAKTLSQRLRETSGKLVDVI